LLIKRGCFTIQKKIKITIVMMVMVCLAIMFNSNVATAKAESTTYIPIPVFMHNGDREKEHTIKNIEEGTIILHKDGAMSDLIINKSLKNPPAVGNIGNGNKRIAVIVGMDEETPIAYAEKGSEQETKLRQTAERNADMEKNFPKYVIAIVAAILGAVILMQLLSSNF